MPKRIPDTTALSFHAFNGDKSQCAVSFNDEFVSIYNTNGSPDKPEKWTKNEDLQENEADEKKAAVLKPIHPGYVSGIDWCASTNAIVTCGHDRNAYVWKYDDAKKMWTPCLVILRIQRAATGVKWSPDGKKFAVSSGNKCVPVCHFEASESFNWWISKMIKKHKSTVLTLDWSPSGKYLVTGGCDFKCRVFSAFIEGIDEEGAEDLGFDKPNEFGEMLAEFDQAKAWVQGVSWAPSGLKVAFVGHGSTLHVADLKSKSVITTYCQTLPYEFVEMLDDNRVVCVGFDNNPTIYIGSGDEAWKVDKKLDPETDTGAKKVSGNAAMNKFRQADSKGLNSKNEETNKIKTYHKACIRDVKIYDGGKTLTTTSVDGLCVTWKL